MPNVGPGELSQENSLVPVRALHHQSSPRKRTAHEKAHYRSPTSGERGKTGEPCKKNDAKIYCRSMRAALEPNMAYGMRLSCDFVHVNNKL